MRVTMNQSTLAVKPNFQGNLIVAECAKLPESWEKALPKVTRILKGETRSWLIPKKDYLASFAPDVKIMGIQKSNHPQHLGEDIVLVTEECRNALSMAEISLETKSPAAIARGIIRSMKNFKKYACENCPLSELKKLLDILQS